jgi:hypothetical protein
MNTTMFFGEHQHFLGYIVGFFKGTQPFPWGIYTNIPQQLDFLKHTTISLGNINKYSSTT